MNISRKEFLCVKLTNIEFRLASVSGINEEKNFVVLGIDVASQKNHMRETEKNVRKFVFTNVNALFINQY